MSIRFLDRICALAPIAVFVFTGFMTDIAQAQESWTPSRWTPFEMTVPSGYCMAQYDGATAKAQGHGSGSGGSYAEMEAVERVCEQYTRNKGWTRPNSGCNSDGTLRTRWADQVVYHPYCYCKTEAITECVDDDEIDRTPARNESTNEPSAQIDVLPTHEEMALVGLLGDVVGYALYNTPTRPQHMNFSGPVRSGTRYVSSSVRANELYKQGMRAYKKDKHTDEETRTAFSSFGACIEADPTHIPCLWELGWVYYVNKGYSATERLWQQVKMLDPNHTDVDEWLNKLQRKL